MTAGKNLLTDNPALYEHQFPDPTGRALAFVDDLARRFGAPGRRVLDAGAGTGRDGAGLAGRGYTVYGVDISAAMVAHARQRYPQVHTVQGDLRTMTVDAVLGAGGADVVTCLDSTLLHLHDTADLLAALGRFHAHLVPGGLLIAEMRNGAFLLTGAAHTELLGGVRTRTVDWAGRTYTSRTRLWVDHAGQLLRRHRQWSGPGVTDSGAPLDQYSAWRLLFPRELRDLLDRSGFDVLALFDAPGPRTDPGWHPGAELSTSLTRDRLHLVARRRPHLAPDLVTDPQRSTR